MFGELIIADKHNEVAINAYNFISDCFKDYETNLYVMSELNHHQYMNRMIWFING
ncbi:MAG: hypothetical protein V4677_02830 [Bacteroidota bacterium]